MDEVSHDRHMEATELTQKKYMKRCPSTSAIQTYHKKDNDPNHRYYHDVMSGSTSKNREELRNRPLSGFTTTDASKLWRTSNS
jgi:hypothetical protein